MRAFALSLNGKKLSVGGVGPQGVLTAMVTWAAPLGDPKARRKRASEHLEVRLGGLDTITGEHLEWLCRTLRTGDRVRIDVLDVKHPDQPSTRKRRDPHQELRAKKRYVRMVARELGWKISYKKS